MQGKKHKSKIQPPIKANSSRTSPAYNYHDFKTKHAAKLLIGSLVLVVLFFFSLFKNISHPLFWADESMTAIGTERVLQFGYPKVHDGKNVFYDLRHDDPHLGIHQEDDAYVGGTGWAQYYYGIIGYKLAAQRSDIYTKTGIYRATFAIAGLLGLGLLAFFMSAFFADKFSRYGFLCLFFLFELMSVSLALLLREVRYYSLVILLTSFILGFYSVYRFHKPFNILLFTGLLTLSLWLLFMTFAPVFFIMIGTVGLSESILAIYQYRKSGIKKSALYILPVVGALLLSLMTVYPFLSYFKTFEISKAMSAFNGFSIEMYWSNISTVLNYFLHFELLWLAIGLKIIMALHAKTLLKEKTVQLRVSGFLSLFFIVFIFLIAKIPNFIYTRYIIYLQPVLAVIIILDFFTLLQYYGRKSSRLVPLKMMIPILLFSGVWIYTMATNFEHIKGHVYELFHPYEGPLDYTIPYLQHQYSKTDTLVIAANYEETSYMYYLNSKVIVGYTGNNLQQDSLLVPDIIAYRRTWGNYAGIFNQFLKKATYEPEKFPVKDTPVNTIPELHFKPAFNHLFRTEMADNEKEGTYLYIRK